MSYRLLLGIHDETLQSIYLRVAQRAGFEVDNCPAPDDFLERARTQHYNCYVMDVNLGSPQSIDVSPAIRAYALIEGKVKAGDASFVAVSASLDAVMAATKANIPARMKPFALRQFLEEQMAKQ